MYGCRRKFACHVFDKIYKRDFRVQIYVILKNCIIGHLGFDSGQHQGVSVPFFHGTHIDLGFMLFKSIFTKFMVL